MLSVKRISKKVFKKAVDRLTTIYAAQARQLDKAYHKEKNPVSWRKHPLSPHTTLFISLVYENMLRKSNGEFGRPKIIDLGCGTGEKTDRLRAFSLDVVGVDIIDTALRKARRLAKKQIIDSSMKIVKADIINLPFPKETFDGAHDYLSFLHIIKQDWLKYVRSVHRVLKKGAPLLIVTFSGNDPDYYGYPIKEFKERGIVFSDKYYKGDPKKVAHLINSYFYFPQKNELKELFRQYFRIIKMDEYPHPLHQESQDHKYRKLWHILLKKR